MFFQLVSEKASKKVYALKTIKKSLANCQVWEERDIMILGRKSEWITRLQYAFTDREDIYLIMEYLPGGDLLGLMIRHGAFDEELARFYLAELALAIHSLHKLGFVHRGKNYSVSLLKIINSSNYSRHQARKLSPRSFWPLEVGRFWFVIGLK